MLTEKKASHRSYSIQNLHKLKVNGIEAEKGEIMYLSLQELLIICSIQIKGRVSCLIYNIMMIIGLC